MNVKRKIAVLVGDGMGDEPLSELDGRTPLQAAQIPAIRHAAALGRVQLIRTVPQGMSPGSDVANMGLLGYHAAENYTGRAAIEAAGAGISLQPQDVAYRTNLVTIRDGEMVDYSAGDISSEEGRALIDALNQAAARDGLQFYGGVSYRHLLVWRDGPAGLTLMPPHEISGRQVASFLPLGPGQEDMLALMELSKTVFADHPVNQARMAKGLNPATQIWPWGAGRAMSLESYAQRFHLSGGVITAVDLIRGLAVLCGLEVIRVDGATGWIDTHYEGKAQAAVEVLERADFVYVHVEAPDECGHKGLAHEKVKAIENFSARVVQPVWQALETAGEPYRLVICTDHRTPVAKKGHTSDPVPFAWVDGPIGDAFHDAEETNFDEFLALSGEPELACDLMARLLGGG